MIEISRIKEDIKINGDIYEIYEMPVSLVDSIQLQQIGEKVEATTNDKELIEKCSNIDLGILTYSQLPLVALKIIELTFKGQEKSTSDDKKKV